MRLIHWSKNKIGKLDNRYIKHKEMLRTHIDSKPRGLWVSDEDDYGWEQWCKDVNFRLDRLRFKYHVKVLKKAKIMYIQDIEQLRWFSRIFKTPSSINFDISYIDWGRVYELVDGIVITPLLPHIGFSEFRWYAGWDCASGCIWNTSVIKLNPLSF